MRFTCQPAGDRAALIVFDQQINEKINEGVIRLAACLEYKKIKGIEEFVPAFSSLMVYYNPLLISYPELTRQITDIELSSATERKDEKVIHDIPVLYGGACGPDLEFIASYHGITEEEVIRIHANEIYRVYMIGFVPGFPYLGGLDSRIHTPRLETPRLKTPAGSVGIAGQQTGIYPLSTPGGWRIIGRTPLPLFRPEQTEKPVLIAAGDGIRFMPISSEQYDEIIKSEIRGERRYAN